MGQLILLTLPGIALALVLRFLVFYKRLGCFFSGALGFVNALAFLAIYQLANVYPALAINSAGLIGAITILLFLIIPFDAESDKSKRGATTKDDGEQTKEEVSRVHEKNIGKETPQIYKDLLNKNVPRYFDKNSENISSMDKASVSDNAKQIPDDKKYYLATEDKPYGPLSLEELKNEKITPKTLVWAEGMKKWKCANKIEGLRGLIKSIPPPIPKGGYLKQVFAQEVRIISLAVFCLFLLGLVYSFINENGVKHLIMRHKWEANYKQTFSDSKRQTLVIESRTLGWQRLPHTRNISATDFHENEAKEILNKAVFDALVVSIIAGLVGFLILGMRWVFLTLRHYGFF